MPNFRSELEMDGEQFRQFVDTVMQRLEPFLSSLDDQPAWDSDDIEEILPIVREPLPQSGEPIDALLHRLFDVLIPKGFNTAGPGYLSYIPGGGLPESAVADLISGVTNRYVGVWQASPGLAQLEGTVVRWICEMIGLPLETAGGFLTTGGSLANWSAIVTARRCRLPENFLNGILYASEQSHHSITKAAMLAGFPPRNVRSIATDSTFRICPESLRSAIEKDRKNGETPFLIVGNAGTTNTGAVDDLSTLATIGNDEKLWFHIDAAYGGFFMLTERGRTTLTGIEQADSITLDPHKGLFLPFGNGALIVRDRTDLHKAHSLDADYLPAMQEADDRVDFCQISPELSRDFRGLRLWLPLKLHGVKPFQESLDEQLDLIGWATEELRHISSIEIVAEPQLSVVAFRQISPNCSEEELTVLNRQLLQRINSGRRVMLTSTFLGDRFVIRICALSFRTHRDRMEECLDAIRSSVAEHIVENVAGNVDVGN